MATIFLRQGATLRLNNTDYSVGQRVVINVSDFTNNYDTQRKFVYECTQAGTTASASPELPTTEGQTMMDGTVQWACRKPSSWENALPHFDSAVWTASAEPYSTVYVAKDYSELDTLSANTIMFTNVMMICVDHTLWPLIIPATGASHRLTSGRTLNFSGNLYIRGVSFGINSGSGTSGYNLGFNSSQTYEDCYFENLNANGQLFLGNTAVTSRTLRLINTTFKLHAVNALQLGASNLYWEGGSVIGTTTAASVFMVNTGGAPTAVISGVDFSAVQSTKNLVSKSATSMNQRMVFRNCKLPTGWTGSLTSASTALTNSTVGMQNCDSGNTNYVYWEEFGNGNIKSDTGVTCVGGATDGTTPYSLKAVSASTCAYPFVQLPVLEDGISFWNETVGSPVTLTLEVLTNGATLTNEDLYLAVECATDSASTLGTVKTSSRVVGVDAAVALPASTATWTGGLGSPVKQKLTATVTPQKKGPIIVRPRLFKASTTVYIDPVVKVS